MTLGEDFPNMQEKMRRCIQRGREIGPAGQFYVMFAEDLLKRADRAAIAGDLPAMIAIYKEMDEFKE